MTQVRSKLGALLEPPDPALLEAGAGGERLVATTRLVFWMFVALAPLGAAAVARRASPIEIGISIGAVGVAILLSLCIVVILRRGNRIPAIGFITGAGDVTLISLVLVAVALAGRPLIVLNSQVAWGVYLLGILATSLRFDIRVCLFVGLVAIAEYCGFVAWAIAAWDVPTAVYASPVSPEGTHGTSLVLHVARVILMFAATALAVGIVYRSRELVRTSSTDRLTGLGNRNYFEKRLAAELAAAARTTTSLTLALMDLDHFKGFNDRWGHKTGDRALLHVTRILQQESRREDLLARWGGEELVLVLRETDAAGGLLKIERIRERLAADVLAVDGQRAPLTISCGLAQFPEDGRDLESLFASADRRLLAAKRAGRNRIVVQG